MTHCERLRALARVMVLLAEIAEGRVGLTLLSVKRDGNGAERCYESADASLWLQVYVGDGDGWQYLIAIDLPDGPSLESRDLTPLSWYVPERLVQVAHWGIG